MLSYKIDGIDAFTANEGESSLMACLRQILAYEEKSVDVKAELAAGKTVMDVLNKYSGGEDVYKRQYMPWVDQVIVIGSLSVLIFLEMCIRDSNRGKYIVTNLL